MRTTLSLRHTIAFLTLFVVHFLQTSGAFPLCRTTPHHHEHDLSSSLLSFQHHHYYTTKAGRTTSKSNLNDVCRIRGGANVNTSTCTSNGGGGVCRFMLSPTFASVLAGSVAGAIGVGVAFPLDTLKTKSQVLGQKYNSDHDKQVNNPIPIGMWSLIRLIYQEEGLAGFFGGVKAMMIGQAFIKALAFSANTFALQMLQASKYAMNHFPNLIRLLIAATFSGFITSFLVAPFERIKVMMQATSAKDGEYSNEIDCIKAVLATEGIGGLMGRGLMPTIVREVPSYGIYFVLYGMLMRAPFFVRAFGKVASLVAGAASGCASWLPVYPVDVVKTFIQNTEGGEKEDAWKVVRQLYADGGVGAFFDGLTPKMLRAAVNHAVTFQLYAMLMSVLPISIGSKK
mmetsp:Transcript_26917/g.41730  ORF Transcript_26917/g.41730 Transcript_26917/m.41730 type:complete len:398 (-) Transcript_26917:18-1211(-)